MRESKRKGKVNPYPGAFRQTTFFHAMHQRKSHAGMRLRKAENRKRKTPENAKQVTTSRERRQEDVMRAEVMVACEIMPIRLFRPSIPSHGIIEKEICKVVFVGWRVEVLS
jgi:hypothetical protein